MAEHASKQYDFDLGSIAVAFLGAVLLLLVLQAISPNSRR